MPRNHYFENYINNLQKEIFLYAYDKKYEITSFISAFMNSQVREEMDKPYSSWHNQPASRIVEEAISESIIDSVENQKVNKNAVEWLGFFYSKWHFITGESSKNILKFLSAKEGLKKFYVLHQLEENEAIEICKRHYNLSRNNHRLNEYKNSDESKKVFDEPYFYSFLAVRLLYKLTNDQIFKQLNYVYENDNYDFIDEEYELGIKGDTILQKDYKSIAENFDKQEKALSNYSRKCVKSIYFCFVFTENSDEENENEFFSTVKKLKNICSGNKRNFDYLYFYYLGKIYEVTNSDEIYVYSMPFSKRERKGILNLMKSYSLI